MKFSNEDITVTAILTVILIYPANKWDWTFLPFSKSMDIFLRILGQNFNHDIITRDNLLFGPPGFAWL